ncbi:DUF4148 domain-containing protein [Collimonas sp. H4R21]|uniref:DUF4148 domain-containing protein n=1 Tax=Collimonas rhizosphaerae TaxID=3126357 RepID=A0ABU9PQL1_9BURK
MNHKQIIASLIVLISAGSAFAEAPYPSETSFVSTKARAEVQAELIEAKAQGLMNQSDASYPVLMVAPLTQEKINAQKRFEESAIAKSDAKIYHGA